MRIGTEIKRHEIVPEKIPIPVKEPEHEPATVPENPRVDEPVTADA